LPYVLSLLVEKGNTIMIHILLADDHPIVREGLRAVLETQPDFEIIAECANGKEVLTQSIENKPDIILLDLEMPVMDGVETIRRLHLSPSVPRVIVFTAFDSDERIIQALQFGCRWLSAERGTAQRNIQRHPSYHGWRIVATTRNRLQAAATPQSAAEQDSAIPGANAAVDELTERELEVLHLLAQGMPNKEIATRLVISERTAKFHVSSIMSKLGATNRTEAVSLAAQRGLITLRA